MISKTTINMAKRRGIDISVVDEDVITKKPTAMFSRIEEDEHPADEYDAIYSITETGMFFIGSCLDNTDEWPYWIESDQHLRKLLDSMAREMA